MNIRTELTHYVSDSELARFLQENYGIDYSVAGMEESGNDTALAYNVDGDVPSYDVDDIQKILAGEWISYRTGSLLNYLAKEGKIPTGAYVITVCW